MEEYKLPLGRTITLDIPTNEVGLLAKKTTKIHALYCRMPNNTTFSVAKGYVDGMGGYMVNVFYPVGIEKIVLANTRVGDDRIRASFSVKEVAPEFLLLEYET